MRETNISDRNGKRRLIAEQALMLKGFKTFRECSKACEALARSKGLDLTFSPNTIQHYITCHCNLSVKRLSILAELVGVKNIMALDERFTPPRVRGVGDYWVGDNGSRVKDIDTTEVYYSVDL